MTLNPELNMKLEFGDLVIVAAHDSDLESLDAVIEPDQTESDSTFINP